jgi:hypothetical protein
VDFDKAKEKVVDLHKDPLSSLRRVSGTNQIEKMRAMMKDARYIIPGMVPQGTITQFYAKPNGGKTLFIMSELTKQIDAGNLIGEDIFYVNVDDNF